MGIERIDYKLAVLVYKCRQGAAPSYLADELRESVNFEAWCRLRSTSSSSLVIHRTRLSTVDDWALLVATACVWNSLPQHVTSAQSLPVFHSRLKTHLFRRCFPWLCCCAWDVTSSYSDTLIVLLTYHSYNPGEWTDHRVIQPMTLLCESVLFLCLWTPASWRLCVCRWLVRCVEVTIRSQWVVL